MRLTSNPWRDVPICAVIVFLMAPIFWPATACDCSKITVGLSNVKHQALGLLLYAGDHDDRYPDRDFWVDGIAPYVKPKEMLRDPDVPKGAYGYAFNGALSHARDPDDPATLPMVYDSTNPIRNASDLVTSLPSPGRHKGRDDIGYADGHVKRVPVGVQP